MTFIDATSQSTVIRESDALQFDALVAPLRGKCIAVLGYGNQGRAHAQNLRDSGLEVIIGGRPIEHGGSARVQAERDGFASMDYAQACARADLVIVALPDQAQPSAWVRWIEPSLRAGTVVGFVHGFAIRFGFIEPLEALDLGIVLLAPKGPGATVRARFVAGQGIPALLAVARENKANAARATAVAWGAGIGCTRSGLLETTFAAEAESDLFGEQAVLCGGMLGLVEAAFDMAVAAGYPPEVAYIECCHELKQVADLLYARGPDGMRRTISDTAEFGAFVAAKSLVDDALKSKLSALLADVRSGAFAARFMLDHANGHPEFTAWRARASAHPIEGASARVRALMPWLAKDGAAS
ncbi:MAG: ketol-acid reductoisomerase [Phycisphaerales bacterium]|nr:ketol-acid reductoisomerase [Phycisphaerales bacterium]